MSLASDYAISLGLFEEREEMRRQQSAPASVRRALASLWIYFIFEYRAGRALLAAKTIALVRHDRVLRGEA